MPLRKWLSMHRHSARLFCECCYRHHKSYSTNSSSLLNKDCTAARAFDQRILYVIARTSAAATSSLLSIAVKAVVRVTVPTVLACAVSIPYVTILRCAILCCTRQAHRVLVYWYYDTFELLHAVLLSTAITTWHSRTQHCMQQTTCYCLPHAILHLRYSNTTCTVLYSTVPYCTILYFDMNCTLLYCVLEYICI
jgi:hypothetical protein